MPHTALRRLGLASLLFFVAACDAPPAGMDAATDAAPGADATMDSAASRDATTDAPGDGGLGELTIGGVVIGLEGAGLVLANGADTVAVSADGPFELPAVADGATYDVVVQTQPTGPHQVCAVSNGSGTVAGSDVTDLVVDCVTSTFTIGGTVTGLLGTGLVLQNEDGDDLAVDADGTFTFATPVASGAAYSVTVLAQPGGPAQSCDVSGGTGTVGGDDVTSITVNCATDTFTIGGTVTGYAGSGLRLIVNATEELPISGDGTFAFPTPLASGSTYEVTIAAQPTAPPQTCVVSSGSGAVGATNVTTIAVACTTDSFTVGGTVTGLLGTGLVLRNSGGDELVVPAGATSFTFATPVVSGATYEVTVATHPAGPSQTCAVSTGTGTVGSGPVTSVAISCTTGTFTVGGTITGLAGGGLVLRDNGGDDLIVPAGATSFTFATPLASGSTYAVTVATEPAGPSQTCTVSSGAGTVGAADVTSVSIACVTRTFTIGGSITGLAGSGLVLRNAGGDDLIVPAGATSFTFATPVASGSMYTVTVATEPSGPPQTCTVTSGGGTVGAADVTSVSIACVTTTFTIGGTISGLSGSGLVLRNNGGNDLTVSPGATSFTFTAPIASGSAYAVTVLAQPSSPSQTCTITSGAGTVGAANVTAVSIACVTRTFTIGGSITGLAGSGLVLRNNGGDALTVASGATSFTFATPVASGTTYAVTVGTQPSGPAQTCTVTSGGGTVGAADVSVSIACVTRTFTIGGTISGLAGSGLVLRNSGGDALTVPAGATSFTFAAPIASGSMYAVTVGTQPSSPSQTCTVTSGGGTVGAANVTGVSIACVTRTFTIGGSITGLTGSGLVLRNGGGDDLIVPAGATSFTFATPVASGSAYVVTVATQPSGPAETCTVTSGAGTVGGADVTSVSIACVPTTYTIGGTITGLSGSGLVLRNNGGDPLMVAPGATTFTFATPLTSGSTFSVTVATQPSAPPQSCVVNSGAGAVGAANVTSVKITCVGLYTIGGTITGLTGSGLVLRNHGGDAITVAAGATSFTFPTLVTNGTYSVTVGTQPSGPPQHCTVTGGSGLVAGADVTTVEIACVGTYTIGGTITGLAGSGLVLRQNGFDAITVAPGATSFTFPTRLRTGITYNVTVSTQPSGPAQTCTVTSGTGTVGTANVTSVSIACVTITYTIGGTITGLAGSGLVLRNNGGDDLIVPAGATSFTFPAPIANGSTYAVTVGTQPSSPSQTCTVTSGGGTVGASNVTSVAVTCATNHYTVGGTVLGLGAAIVLRNNGGDALPRTADGAFTFATTVASGGAYAVTLAGAVDGSVCTVTNGTGTVTSAPITGVVVRCRTPRAFYAPHAIAGAPVGNPLAVVGPDYAFRISNIGPISQAACQAACDADSTCESVLWRGGGPCTLFPFACPQWAPVGGNCAVWDSGAYAYQSGSTCEQIKESNPGAVDGTYSIDPRGVGTPVRSVYCDMTTDGGGWTLGFVRNSVDTGAHGLFGGADTSVGALAASPNAASSSSSAVAGWLDLNAMGYSELRISAHQAGARTYLSENIRRGEMINRFGTGGAYLLQNDSNGYSWCGGNAAWNDAGNCKGHSGLGSGWDFGPAGVNAGLTMCGGDAPGPWMHGAFAGAQTFYPTAGAAQAIWVR